MPSNPTSQSAPTILAVVVLYQCSLAQSQSVSSLLQILIDNPEFAKYFSLVLYDNSPQAQSLLIEADFPICYFHDGSNRGLPAAYNFALARAETEQCTWLLLLDQDTWLTREFIAELLATTKTLHAQPDVAAIVPKLMVHGKIDSPATHFFDLMRGQFQAPRPAMRQDVVGIQQQRLACYNSGATLRVSALRNLGGFPPEYWLDFLDHAVFHALFVGGFRLYVLLARLQHDSSYADIGSVPAWRFHNILLARTLYVTRNGTFLDRLLYRVWLVRNSRNLREACKDPRVWKETALQALFMRIPKKRDLPPPYAP
jgi:GT2 family glycosyltransferase